MSIFDLLNEYDEQNFDESQEVDEAKIIEWDLKDEIKAGKGAKAVF